MREVAIRAGVSTATVSHVINGTRTVSSSLTGRVLEAMEELDYRPDVIARSLRRGQTMTIGLMTPSVSIPFYAEVAEGIESAARDAGYSVILCNTGWSLDGDLYYLDNLLARRVDGLACISLSLGVEHLAPAFNRRTPVLTIERTIADAGIDSVEVNNFHGAYDATKHLVELGHTRIACVTGLPNSALTDARVLGYRTALEEGGIAFDPSLVCTGDYTVASGIEHATTLLDISVPPTAVFAFNDMMALGVMNTVLRRGLRIPDDVAIVGFDGVALTEHTWPPLTTVRQPISEMSAIAVQMLLDRIAGNGPPSARVETVEPTLVVRESTLGTKTGVK